MGVRMVWVVCRSSLDVRLNFVRSLDNLWGRACFFRVLYLFRFSFYILLGSAGNLRNIVGTCLVLLVFLGSDRDGCGKKFGDKKEDLGRQK
jgi:hypothetical protein